MPPSTMAQIPLTEKFPTRSEIEEIDESKNVVATYITSAANDGRNNVRIDVLVRTTRFYLEKIRTD